MRDLGGLESALARPHAAFGDTEFYPDVFTKAAVLMDGLTRNHAFIDGNKRVAAAITETFLDTNGARLLMTDEEIVQLFLDIASGLLDRELVEQQLRQRIVRT